MDRSTVRMRGETGETESARVLGAESSIRQGGEGERMVTWAYGVITVPERKDSILQRTLTSLSHAGFPLPHIFVDEPRIKVYGRWLLSAWELFIRNPVCDRYAFFQDDFITYRNLRSYLDRTIYLSSDSTLRYYNLITELRNEQYVQGKPQGWLEAESMNTPQRLQYGKGAVALVFNREALMTLLSARHLVERVITADLKRKDRNVDGAIVTAMNYAGYREYIHNPSLVQHVGTHSTVTPGLIHQPNTIFLGENYDALSLLKQC